jgi:hypothetical protein
MERYIPVHAKCEKVLHTFRDLNMKELYSQDVKNSNFRPVKMKKQRLLLKKREGVHCPNSYHQDVMQNT